MGCKKASTPAVKYVYNFGGNNSEGNETMRALLGGKGANLAGMAAGMTMSAPEHGMWMI